MTYARPSSRFVGLGFSALVGVTFAALSACGGSSFDSGGSAGDSGAGGSGASSGSTSVAGTSANGGTDAGGGTTANGGSTSSAGASGTTAAGSGGTADCAAMKTEYAATVEKARGCDMGSTDECSPSSTMPVFGCGCSTLVNAKSPYTDLAKKEYQAIQDAKCPVGAICNIACIANTTATCSSQTTSAGTAYECTGTVGGIAN